MVYKLDDADKLCGVTYIDWSKKYSKIPKATCETIKQQCSSGGGGSSDDALDLSCEEIKKLLKGEDKPKEDKPKEDTPNEGNKEETPKENDTPTEDKPQENPKEEETPKENNTPGENNTPREETPSDNVGGNPPTEEKHTTDEVTPKEPEPNTSPREEETPRTEEAPAEPTPEPPVADTPREETPNEEGKEVNLLELMPRVEDKLSTVYIQANISSVTNPNKEEKDAFERKIIENLKSKLPEGAVVEAVLGEPYYKVGMEYSEEITNYKLNVRVTLKGKVYEHEYNVPDRIEYIGITDYI